MNVPTAVATKAIDIDLWDRWIDADGVEHRQDEYQPAPPLAAGCYGGLDLASVRDLTALILLFLAEDGLYDALCWFWCPEDGVQERSKRDGVPYADWVRDGYLIATPGNVTDYAFVEAKILEQAELFAIGEIGYDRWNATQLATDLMQDGAPMIAIPQTHAGLGPAWRELDKLIIEGKAPPRRPPDPALDGRQRRGRDRRRRQPEARPRSIPPSASTAWSRSTWPSAAGWPTAAPRPSGRRPSHDP